MPFINSLQNHLKNSQYIIPVIHCITVTSIIKKKKKKGKMIMNCNVDKGLFCLLSTQMAMLPSVGALTESLSSMRPLYRKLVRISFSATLS